MASYFNKYFQQHTEMKIFFREREREKEKTEDIFLYKKEKNIFLLKNNNYKKYT